MKIIKTIAYESGSRPPLQDWSKSALPEGYVWCPDEFVEVFYSTSPAGFVNIEVENDTVVGMTINQEALDAYIASLPEPTPEEPAATIPERVEKLEEEKADKTDVQAVWYQMAEAYQEGVEQA